MLDDRDFSFKFPSPQWAIFMGEGGNSQDKFVDPKIYTFLESLGLKDNKKEKN